MIRMLAMVVAIAYGVCALAPAAAFAFSDQDRAAHCLTDQAHDADAAGTPLDHSDDQADAKGSCCGLGCLTALATLTQELAPHAGLCASAVGFSLSALLETSPEQLHRPPIVLRSM